MVGLQFRSRGVLGAALSRRLSTATYAVDTAPAQSSGGAVAHSGGDQRGAESTRIRAIGSDVKASPRDQSGMLRDEGHTHDDAGANALLLTHAHHFIVTPSDAALARMLALAGSTATAPDCAVGAGALGCARPRRHRRIRVEDLSGRLLGRMLLMVRAMTSREGSYTIHSTPHNSRMCDGEQYGATAASVAAVGSTAPLPSGSDGVVMGGPKTPTKLNTRSGGRPLPLFTNAAVIHVVSRAEGDLPINNLIYTRLIQQCSVVSVGARDCDAGGGSKHPAPSAEGGAEDGGTVSEFYRIISGAATLEHPTPNKDLLLSRRPRAPTSASTREGTEALGDDEDASVSAALAGGIDPQALKWRAYIAEEEAADGGAAAFSSSSAVPIASLSSSSLSAFSSSSSPESRWARAKRQHFSHFLRALQGDVRVSDDDLQRLPSDVAGVASPAPHPSFVSAQPHSAANATATGTTTTTTTATPPSNNSNSGSGGGRVGSVTAAEATAHNARLPLNFGLPPSSPIHRSVPPPPAAAPPRYPHQQQPLPNPNDLTFYFWPFRCDYRSAVAYESTHFVVLVNLKPVTDGHLMVVPRRVMPTVHSLSHEEVEEWGYLVKHCCLVLAKVYAADAQGISLAIQQGRAAGQTVPHLHTHVIVYRESGELDGEPEAEEAEQLRRRPRTQAAMQEESDALRRVFVEMEGLAAADGEDGGGGVALFEDVVRSAAAASSSAV